MAVNLPYNLQERQIAYAAKVMANFEALLGAYNLTEVKGLGTGDIPYLLRKLFLAAIKAYEPDNAQQIIFSDGESLADKFDAGDLNASILNSDSLFYFHIDPVSGHLMVTCSDSVDEGDFSIGANGHLLYTLADPGGGDVDVHTYDLGRVRGEQGPVGPASPGDMDHDIYDPRELEKDLNHYVVWFNCPYEEWGRYFLTYDDTFVDGKTYYVLDGSDYVLPNPPVTVGADVPLNLYYEKLPDNEFLLTDGNRRAGATNISDHISDGSGHAIISVDMEAIDTAKQAWNNACVTAVAQGEGIEGADNASSWIRLRALGAIPEVNIKLTLVFFQ